MLHRETKPNAILVWFDAYNASIKTITVQVVLECPTIFVIIILILMLDFYILPTQVIVLALNHVPYQVTLQPKLDTMAQFKQ